jgi:hypothetical protein
MIPVGNVAGNERSDDAVIDHARGTADRGRCRRPHRGASSMSVLINDLLAFSRLGRTATAAWSQLDCETVRTGSATPCTPTLTSPNPSTS